MNINARERRKPKLRDQYGDVAELVDSLTDGSGSVSILVSKYNYSEGAATVARQQATRLVEAGHDVKVFAFEIDEPHRSDHLRQIGMLSKRVPRFGKQAQRASMCLNPLAAFLLARKLEDDDVFIVHQPVLSLPALVAQTHFDVTGIYYNNLVLSSEKHAEFTDSIFEYAYCRLFEKLAAKMDIVVSVSKYSRETFYRNFGRSGPVIYNTVDGEKYNQSVSGDEVRRQHGIGDRPIVLFVGRVIKRKGVYDLLRVFERITEEVPEAALIVVGRTHDTEYYRKVYEYAKHIDAEVIFTGVVPEEMLPKYYAAADVYATCSALESFDLTILEAELCGTPTVAFDTGAHSEVMTNGRLVETGDLDEFERELLDQLR